MLIAGTVLLLLPRRVESNPHQLLILLKPIRVRPRIVTEGPTPRWGSPGH